MKIFIFDIDGVLIPVEKFSLRYSKEYNVPFEIVLPFFKGVFQDCLIGKADLKEELPKVFNEWQWTKSLDELIHFWFSGEENIDKDLVNAINEIKSRGYKVIGASKQEKYRAQYLKESLKLNEIFDELYFSCDLGYKKPDKKFYEVIIKDLNTKPENMYYWDDEQQNVDAGNELGIDSYLYTGFKEFEKTLTTIN